MKSPGHEKWPDHKVNERRFDRRVTVEVDGEVVADSRNVIEVAEDDQPRRFYFPRGDVKMDKLERSRTTTQCPFKGTASYFSLLAGGKKLEDTVWAYEDPFEEHSALKDRVAFWDEKIPGITIRESPERSAEMPAP